MSGTITSIRFSTINTIPFYIYNEILPAENQ